MQMRTHRTYLMDCTVVSPMTLMLFGGRMSIKHSEGCVLIDEWMRLRAAAPTAVLIKKLRQALDMLLRQKVERPEADLTESSAAIVTALSRMLLGEEKMLQMQA